MATMTLPTVTDRKPDTITLLPLEAYDLIIVSFSGGKDSLAMVLDLIERGVDPDKVQLWHQDVDGVDGVDAPFMDWPCTRGYCKAVADYMGIRLLFQCRKGGFKAEMMKENDRSRPVRFERQDGTWAEAGGVKGAISTRLKFPQKTADLSVRWCSASLKIEAAALALNNDPALVGKKILFLTGERREESTGRSRYAEMEPHRCSSGKKRVDAWRSVIDWTEKDVWAIIERHGILPHPAYRLGWPRVSCAGCFAGEVEVVTRDGIKPIRELAGGRHRLLIPKSPNGGLHPHGSFEEVEVRSFGVQPLLSITLRRNRQRKVIRATAEHRWFIQTNHARPQTVECVTTDLRPGNKLRAVTAHPPGDAGKVPFAIAQGFVYGDGSVGDDDRPARLGFYNQDKYESLIGYFAGHEAVRREDPKYTDGEWSIYGLPRLWKQSPCMEESRSFLLSWLAGYFAADGCVSKSGQAVLSSARRESIEVARNIAAICGISHGQIRSVTRLGRGKEPTPLFSLTLDVRDLPDWFFIRSLHRGRVEEHRGHQSTEERLWVVESVEATGQEEEVFCAVVPGVTAFGLADGILTGNCIFGGADQWASLRVVAPAIFQEIAEYEQLFDCTIDRKRTVVEMADAGTPYPETADAALVAEAMDHSWSRRVGGYHGSWQLPAGAFKRGGGPI